MNDEAQGEPERGILGFLSTATETGGALTEEAFFSAMQGAFKYGREPTRIVTSQATITAGQDAGAAALDRAQRLYLEELVMARGWRRLRVLRRLRLAREAARLYEYGLALQKTFGTPSALGEESRRATGGSFEFKVRSGGE